MLDLVLSADDEIKLTTRDRRVSTSENNGNGLFGWLKSKIEGKGGILFLFSLT